MLLKIALCLRHLNEWYACNAPYFYQLRPSAGDSKKYRSGQLFVEELPSNAVKEVYPSRGKCTNDKLCFRVNQNWSCDTGICNRRTLDQKIELVTGTLTKNCYRQGILRSRTSTTCWSFFGPLRPRTDYYGYAEPWLQMLTAQ